MMKKYLLAGILILAIMLSGCARMYEGAAVEVTPTSAGAFAGQSPQQTMAALQTQSSSQSTTQTPDLTAAAATGTVVAGGTAITPQTQITFTATPVIGGGFTTMTPGAATTPAPGVTPQPGATTAVPPTAIVGRPATYILQSGEFPYCIARRFNVDPDELLSLSGLSAGVIYSAGTVLKIPQSGSFPGDRALRAHPATYTVTGNSDTTIYAVACIFGDADPASIAQRNNLSISAQLSVGQQLAIP